LGRIGLIGAMDSEIAHYLEAMESVESQTIYGIQFYQGRLEQHPVVLCKSGVGKVNAAICTQLLIERFRIEKIIFTGVAGALHPDLDIGDIVISTECQYHDIDASVLGFPKGTIPFQETSIFPADPDLIQLAVEAGEQIGKQKVLSGDQFISDPQLVRLLHQDLSGVCVEMEGAAVAHVCFLTGVPYVVIRSMSDRADQSAHVNFVEFEKLAAKRSYRLVCSILQKLGFE
jgi:adenosylhomocysteine nucleosidase